VHLTPLSSATVLLDGTTLSATTDDEGKFRIDSIPPGSYRIAVFHPMLDTLGFSIGTKPLRMGADSVRQVILGTPSAQSIVENACTPIKRRLGPGAIMGHVLDPETNAPLADVRVTMVWSKLEVGQSIGVRRTPQLREATTDSSGAFTLCGLPTDIHGTLMAERGEAKTAEVPMDISERELLAFQTLHMSNVAPTDSGPTTGDAELRGRVVGKNGAPVAGARVSLQGTSIITSTLADGSFTMTGLPSGTRAVFIKRVGFAPQQVAVDLSSKSPAHITVTLEEPTNTLAAVNVEGKYEAALKKNGYDERKRMGMGHFLGPKDIARRQPQYFSSLFQTIPGFRLVPGPGGTNSIASTRGSNGCVTIWVDGVQWRQTQSGELDNLLQPDQLMAIETYSGVSAPAQFQSAGQTDCSVIVVWTNRTVR
jgi:hypothetical protein